MMERENCCAQNEKSSAGFFPFVLRSPFSEDDGSHQGRDVHHRCSVRQGQGKEQLALRGPPVSPNGTTQYSIDDEGDAPFQHEANIKPLVSAYVPNHCIQDRCVVHCTAQKVHKIQAKWCLTDFRACTLRDAVCLSNPCWHLCARWSHCCLVWSRTQREWHWKAGRERIELSLMSRKMLQSDMCALRSIRSTLDSDIWGKWLLRFTDEQNSEQTGRSICLFCRSFIRSAPIVPSVVLDGNKILKWTLDEQAGKSVSSHRTQENDNKA